jgi:competence protein ComEC
VAGRIAAWVIWPLVWLGEWLARARGQLFVWIPVFMGTGIGIWFALPREPSGPLFASLCVIAAAAFLTIWRGPEAARPVCIAIICTVFGFCAAGMRAQIVAAPMLDFRYYGPVQGRVLEIDRSQSDALRITLDQVVLGDVAPSRTPARVRISLQGAPNAPNPGEVVILTAHLSAPEGPTEPNAFNFRRMAFFQGLGAVGYTRSPVLLWQPPAQGAQYIDRLRAHISAAMLAHMPSQAGAFATGAMTGDRSAITQDTVVALRDSNLSHLLAISGMNLAFLAGFVFLILRYGIALVPPLALRVNAKKIAATVALAVAAFYWLLSGANVSTTRAMVMIAVMLGAVLLDRQAISMRAVAIAAIVLLAITPESLHDAGFQLSFAATVALVGGYAALNRAIMAGRAPRWLMPFYALVLTSIVAGMATAPYAAAHFNRFTDYGLLANLATVWAMSVLMAAGVVAALLAPIGLAAPALWVMEGAGAWILAVAHWIAGLEGAVTGIPAPGAAVLPLITLGGLWLLVWQGRRRWLGVPVLALALGLWAITPRPDLLISRDGRVAGLMHDGARALSHPTGAGFVVRTWLESDGDFAGQEAGAARGAFAGPKEARSFDFGPYSAVLLSGKGAALAFEGACAAHDVVILPAALDPSTLPASAQPCLRIDRTVLDSSGTLSGQVVGGDLVLRSTHTTQRLWDAPRAMPAPIIFSLAGGVGSGRTMLGNLAETKGPDQSAVSNAVLATTNTKTPELRRFD